MQFDESILSHCSAEYSTTRFCTFLLAEEDGPISAACTRKAAAAGLSAAASQARIQAEEEEIEVQKLLREAIAAQQELLENRLKLFPDMLQAVREEHTSLQARTTLRALQNSISHIICKQSGDRKVPKDHENPPWTIKTG